MNLREKAKKACRLGKKGIPVGDSNNTDAYDKIYDIDDDEFDEEEQNMEDAYYRYLIGNINWSKS